MTNIRWFLALTLVVIASSASADIAFNTNGQVYNQDFDTLNAINNSVNAWADDSSIPGWYTNQISYIASTGSSTAASIYSFGPAGQPDRAIGSITTAPAGTNLIGVGFVNNTGATMTRFQVTFDGEQWRKAVNAVQQTLTFDYNIGNGISINSAGYVPVSQLDFAGPVVGPPGGLLNGNLPVNRVAGISFWVNGVNWLPGQQMKLRWSDVDDPGTEHGLGIDNFSFTAIPEPTTFGLGSLVGLAALAIFRRRK
ncbi:MAG: PEP-CTERM sorting domain-containing protein [Pirellulaceae bacterium]